MATLTTNTITKLGVAESLVSAAGGGDACSCGTLSQPVFLYVKNAGGSSMTVTLNVPASKTVEPNVAASVAAVTVASSTSKLIGPIDQTWLADPVTGLCSITYSAVTSVTVGVYQIAQP